MNSPSPNMPFSLPHSDATTDDADRSIGAILIKGGQLSLVDAERIQRFQKERNMRFGDAAVSLGLLTAADIELALSRQFEYSYLLRGESPVSESVVAAYEPFTRRVESMRALRNQLMWRWFNTGANRRAIAITGAERQVGRSFIAANLAVVFAQQGQRTLLIDADMRNPCQHKLFGLENRVGLSSILSGRNGPDAVQSVPSLPNLSVLTVGAPPPNPLELLGRPIFGHLITALSANFDVILVDTPSSVECSDAQTIAARTGASLIVTQQDISRIDKVRDLMGLLSDASTQILGTVLNDF
jgi:receptor protein-tyrosine kinase